jgi:hypothetical protein
MHQNNNDDSDFSDNSDQHNKALYDQANSSSLLMKDMENQPSNEN